MPAVQSTGFEDQEPRPCAADATLGLTEGQEPRLPGITADIIINDEPERNTQNVCSKAQDQPTPSLLPLDTLIPDSVKQTTWADEYVELAQLLKPSDWG